MKFENEKIFVTRPSLPDLKEFLPFLEEIWEKKWLTNNGDFHQQLEKELADYLGVKYISLFSNGTLALITALQALKITGEVITTPYSFVATTHALWWNNIKPVFADIKENDCNIDHERIEAAITPKTTAILPVHVYGNPCDVIKIQEIADTYGLKVIYDAAHAFGVRPQGWNIFEFGDLSILSFHATKVFHTFEGGAIISHDERTKRRIDDLKNFGFRNETNVIAPGINAKMNEIQAAMGLLQLKHIDKNIENRKNIAEKYLAELYGIKGVQLPEYKNNIRYNYSYFPIFIDENLCGISRDKLYECLKKENIFTRRYFYPLISNFATYRSLDSAAPKNLSVANKIAEEVLCLPMYSDLKNEDVDRVCKMMRIYL